VAAAATGRERVVEEEVPSVGKGTKIIKKQQRIVALLRSFGAQKQTLGNVLVVKQLLSWLHRIHDLAFLSSEHFCERLPLG
jgi:hypothetical protein